MKSTRAEKQAVVWVLKKHTTITVVWLASRLRLGHRTNASRAISVFDRATDSTRAILKEKMLQITGWPFGRADPLALANERWTCFYDQAGAIGRRYRRQDEIGTPLGVTIDFDTLEDDTVTVRDRDTMDQVRLPISELEAYIAEKVRF